MIATELQEAITRHEGYLKVDPDNYLLWLNLGDLYHRVMRCEEAIACYEKAVMRSPGNNVPRGRIAAVLISEHRFSDAEKILRELIATGDTSPELLHNLGLALYYQKRWSEAQTCFENALAGGLHAHQTLDYLAHAMHYQGQLEPAIEICRRWAASAGDAESKGYLALLEMDNGNMADASQLADEVLVLAPDNTDATVVAGTAAIERQEIEKAESFFKRLADRQPDNPRGWLGLGLVHMYRQKHEEAIVDLQKATQLMPDNTGAIVTLGWAQLAHRDIPGAEKTFRQAIAVDRNLAESHGGLAVALALQARVDEAKQAIQLATGLDRHGFGAIFAQSILLKLQGRDRLATEIVARLLQHPPTEGARPLIEYIQEFVKQSQGTASTRRG